jgi:hypothetical protein
VSEITQAEKSCFMSINGGQHSSGPLSKEGVMSDEVGATISHGKELGLYPWILYPLKLHSG